MAGMQKIKLQKSESNYFGEYQQDIQYFFFISFANNQNLPYRVC